jgi:single-stranded-DNA-specific exonuclease
MLALTEATGERISLTGRHWAFREADERSVTAYTQKFSLPDIVARILVARGIAFEAVEAFLNPSLKASLPDPSHLLDMDIAAGRVAAAVAAGEGIAIFGDYDVDGATSSALLARYLRALGASPVTYIPDRMKEGYGPNAKALLELKARGAALVITVDCGTMSFEPLEAAHDAGLDVIVIDHHIGEARRPKAVAIVNPNRIDENSPHRQLAAVGVAFLLVVAVNRALRNAGWFAGRREPDPRQWLDVVALGTVCDVVPLSGLNRALVAQGLKIMAARGNLGLRTVLDVAGVAEAPGVYHAGFVIGPRINAGGRVGRADLGVRLLTTEDPAEALMLARELEMHNAERKAIEAQVLEEALAMAEAQDSDRPLIVVAGQGWHQGVIGIVAGRIKERLHKPVAVIALADGIGKASARSVAGIDFGAAVISARDAGLLVAGGGHAMAAGFTVEEAKIPALTEFLINRMRPQAGGLTSLRRLMIDGRISIGGATPELVAVLEQIGPFGQANPSIRLVVQNVVNLKPDIVGEHHVKTLLIDPLSNARLSAIAFRVVGTSLGDALLSTRGKKLDVAGQLRVQQWNGQSSVSLMIDDVAEA